MFKLKRTIASLLAVLAISSVAAVTALASSDSEVSGGWSESGGYYINAPFDLSIQTNASARAASGTPSATPDRHTGKRLTKIVNNGGDAKYASHGETVWYYKYHYTTAQMELSNGTVKTTSGRVWGVNATEATSPYYSPFFENTEARTYWGS